MLKIQKVFHDGSDFKNQGFAARNVGKVGGWKEHWKGIEAQNALSYGHLLQRILPFSKDLYNFVWNLDFCFFSLINKIMINIIHSFLRGCTSHGIHVTLKWRRTHRCQFSPSTTWVLWIWTQFLRFDMCLYQLNHFARLLDRCFK